MLETLTLIASLTWVTCSEGGARAALPPGAHRAARCLPLHRRGGGASCLTASEHDFWEYTNTKSMHANFPWNLNASLWMLGSARCSRRVQKQTEIPAAASGTHAFSL
ncbi:hypothetical protein CesoFtcFv8_004354 [Champsocephalus esox]|uniref:Uncharacterized protein n=1 Tax=Champsocephalus esox TaxID=159716 RepID=A0AAN8CU94_9TELE|nr:hypothetical protein CesoFtcFv8_004354 [Champsocephalus esox]